MGYGKNLKEALDSCNMTVKKLSNITGISPTTLYSIIQRDSAVRYDHAIRISNALGIDVSLICKENPYSDGDVLPELLNDFHGLFSSLNKDTYKKYRMSTVFDLYDYKDFDKIDQLLSNFYVLDDDGRREVFDFIKIEMMRHTDKTRFEKFNSAFKPK